MLDRKTLLGLVVAGFSLTAPSARCFAQAAPATLHADVDRHDDYNKDPDEERRIEQPVPMAFIPTAVLDAVKKEVPDGSVANSELEAGRGRIMYLFHVKSGEIAYEVKITVDGKFFSKQVEEGRRRADRRDETDTR